MKVLLYEQNANLQKKSGIGRALRHQKKALELNGVEVTFNPKENYDLVHINSSFSKSYRFVKRLNKKKIPCVVHGHSTYEDFRQSFRLWRLIEPWFDRNLSKIYGEAKYIITPTPYSKSLIENYKVTKCPVEAISNGVDLSLYQHDEEKIKAYKEHFKLKEGQKVVISIGLLFKRKGLLDFMEVARKMPDVTFIWFGALNSILIPHEINKAIRQRPKNVIMAGYIDGAIIKGALQGADCFFFPSYEETEGIVVLEALASKIPLLVRDIGVYNGWLKNNYNCYMANNNAEFIEKINYIFTHDNQEMINNGYEVAKERDLAIIGKALINAYNNVIANTKKHDEE